MKTHIPNILTFLRLIVSLAMFAALVAIGASLRGAWTSGVDGIWLARFAAGAFVIAAVSDFFDGWLARRWGVVSLLGAVLDPIADKILVCGAILGLLAIGAPGILVPGGLILFREFAVSALREVLAPRGLKLPVTFLAKTKTALQLTALGAILILMVWPVWRINARIDHLRTALEAALMLFDIAAVVTLWTGFEYGRSAWRALKDAQSAIPPAAE